MSNYEMSNAEQKRRKEIAVNTRKMIIEHIPVEDQDETSLTLCYRDYFMQLSFSALHPLLVICLAKAIGNPGGIKKQRLTNQLNLYSVIGCHAINEDVGCYSYRATHWLDTELTSERFYEILDRCVDEADRAFRQLAS